MIPFRSSLPGSSPQRGFTLVETLVAITILMIAISVPFYSIQQAIRISNAARDELIASSLAQEGVEYIYFLRNNNYFSGAGWLNGMNNCTGTNGCTVDAAQNSLQTCGSQGCPAIMLSPAGLYTQTGSYTPTRFTRTVKLQSVSATQETVTVSVTWESGHQSYTIDVVENLYNWI